MRRVVVAGLALLAVLVVVVALAAVPGHYETVPRTTLGRTAPAWSKPCAAAAAVVSAPWSVCGQVAGRAVWVENRDADGDGDKHVVLLARGHVRVVKIATTVYVRRNPRIGDRLKAVGAVTKGARAESEVDAQKVVIRGAAGL